MITRLLTKKNVQLLKQPISLRLKVVQEETFATLQDKFPGSSYDESVQDVKEKQVSQESPTIPILQPSSRIQKNHLISCIIGDPQEGRRTRDKHALNYRDMINNSCFISSSEPKNIKE